MMPQPNGLMPLWVQDPARWAEAEVLAQRYGLALQRQRPEAAWTLVLDGACLSALLLAPGSPGAVAVDWLRPEWLRRERGGLGQELLVRAVGGARDLDIADVTAGWGEDAWLLAQAGARMTLVERHNAVMAMLADGQQRALQAYPQHAGLLAMRLVHQGAQDWLQHLAQPVDVVYLDPMFPERRKGLPHKGMQVFHALVGADADADALLPLARQRARRRVVVKRPRLAPPLAGLAPHSCYSGRSIRFDVYLPLPP